MTDHTNPAGAVLERACRSGLTDLLTAHALLTRNWSWVRNIIFDSLVVHALGKLQAASGIVRIIGRVSRFEWVPHGFSGGINRVTSVFSGTDIYAGGTLSDVWVRSRLTTGVEYRKSASHNLLWRTFPVLRQDLLVAEALSNQSARQLPQKIAYVAVVKKLGHEETARCSALDVGDSLGRYLPRSGEEQDLRYPASKMPGALYPPHSGRRGALSCSSAAKIRDPCL